MVREGDFIGRAGGDEFILWISRLPNPEVINKTLEKIKQSLDLPFETEKDKINLEYNLSLVLYPKDGKTFEELFERASLTLKLAKEEESKFKFFDAKLEKDFQKFISSEVLIIKALEKNLFYFYYLPIWDISTYKIVHFEALVRIKDGQKIYTPAEFIDYLEASPYLRSFEAWAFRKIIEMIQKWNHPFALNISARTFFEKDFINRLREIPQDILPYLALEITERALIKDLSKAKKNH